MRRAKLITVLGSVRENLQTMLPSWRWLRYRRTKTTAIVLALICVSVVAGKIWQHAAEQKTMDDVISGAVAAEAQMNSENTPKIDALLSVQSKHLLEAPVFHSAAWTSFVATTSDSDDNRVVQAKHAMQAIAYHSFTFPDVREQYLVYIRRYKNSIPSDQKVQIYALGVIDSTCADISKGISTSQTATRFAPAFAEDTSGTVLPQIVEFAKTMCSKLLR